MDDNNNTLPIQNGGLPLSPEASKKLAKELADNAKKGAQFFEDLSKALDEKKYVDLDTISKLMTASKFLGKFSVAIGALGVVLGVIAFFFKEESDTEKILKAIDKLSGKIDNLQKVMIDQFKHLEHVVELTAAKTQISPHLNLLKTLRHLIVEYEKSADDPVQHKLDRDRLLRYTSRDIELAVEGIHSQCLGENLATNIFEASYDKTYGSISFITELGIALHTIAIYALFIDSYLWTIKNQKDGKEDVESAAAQAKNSNKLFSPLVEGIYNAWESCYKKCIKNIESNATRKIETEGFPKYSNAGNHGSSAKGIHRLLEDQWPMFDWTVLVYDPVGGYHNHSYLGSAMSWFRQNVPGGQINIVINKVDKKEPEPIDETSQIFRMFALEPDTFGALGIQNRSWDNLEDAIEMLQKRLSNSPPKLIWIAKPSCNSALVVSNNKRVKYVKGDDYHVFGVLFNWPRRKSG